MQFLTHYERYNINKWEQHRIMPNKNFAILNNSFMEKGCSLIGFQVQHEEKRIHYSVSSMDLDRLKSLFSDNWLNILNKGMVASFKHWEQGNVCGLYKENYFS